MAQELPNEELKKISKLHRIMAWCPVFPLQNKKKNSINTSKKLLKNSNSTYVIVRYFTWKLEFVSNTCGRNTSNLMASQRIKLIGSFNYIPYWLTSFDTLLMKGDSFISIRLWSLSALDWALGNNSMEFWDFRFQSFGNSWGNSYTSVYY